MTKHQKFLKELTNRITTCEDSIAMINSGLHFCETDETKEKSLAELNTAKDCYTEMHTVFSCSFRDELEVTSQSEVL